MSENSELQKTDEYNLTLAEKLKLRRTPMAIDAILLDVSSSMGIDVEPGKSRWEALREILSSVKFKGRKFFFNSQFGEVTADKPLPAPTGGTMLAALLDHIKAEGCKSCLIITDGEVHDKIQVRESKKGMKIKVMFVGTVKPAFLDELATDGHATVEDLAQTKQLTDKIQLLLSASDATASDKGPIQL